MTKWRLWDLAHLLAATYQSKGTSNTWQRHQVRQWIQLKVVLLLYETLQKLPEYPSHSVLSGLSKLICIALSPRRWGCSRAFAVQGLHV